MIPIQLDKNEFRDKTALRRKILNICSDSHLKNSAKIFSILLYNESNVFVHKMLKDEDFFDSLNFLSGNILSIMFLSTFHGNFSYEQNRVFNNSIEEIFEIENKNKKELLILFQVNNENAIIDYYIYKFNDINTNYVYNLLKEVCIEIKKSLEYIKDENRYNYQQISNLAIENLKCYKKGKILKVVLRKVLTILNVVSSIETFFP